MNHATKSVQLLIVALHAFGPVNAVLAGDVRAGSQAAASTEFLKVEPGGTAQGPIVPAEGPDGTLWLCKEDEEAQQSVCIPWFPEADEIVGGYFGLSSGAEAKGPVIPVEGPDGLLWLCREDDEAQQSICIPWFQDAIWDGKMELAAAGGVSKGPVIPVEGPDGLLWLCREDDEAQQSICIPWFQESATALDGFRGDVNQDGKVDIVDFEILRISWWAPLREMADLNGDTYVDDADLDRLMASWGECRRAACVADINADGRVDTIDLELLLSAM